MTVASPTQASITADQKRAKARSDTLGVYVVHVLHFPSAVWAGTRPLKGLFRNV